MSVSAIAPADQAITGSSSLIGSAKSRSVRSSIPTWPPVMTRAALSANIPASSPRCQAMTSLSAAGARASISRYRDFSSVEYQSSSLRTASIASVSAASAVPWAEDRRCTAYTRLQGALEPQAVEGQELVVAVAERERGGGEPLVLVQHVHHPVVQPEVASPAVEDGVELRVLGPRAPPIRR